MERERKNVTSAVRSASHSVRRENRTGIPTQLKECMEQSTGLSFDDVRVHYNSALPARLDALAYTQGNQVEIAPGQERHLPHELGHVVQQKLGAVRANATHSSGVALNTDPALEHQADELGAGKKLAIVQRMRNNNIIQRCGDKEDSPEEEEKEDESQEHSPSSGSTEEDEEVGAGGSGTKGYSVDPTMFAGDVAAGVLRNGEYITNPTAHNINDYIHEGSNYLGSKNMNGQYMYVIDMDGNMIIGTRGGQRMPHPTLVGGNNPQVQAAGILEIRGGKIYSINNLSGHFKPDNECLSVVEELFSKLPSKIFSRKFKGYSSFG